MRRKNRQPKPQPQSDAERRSALVSLGPEALADSLMKLSQYSKEAAKEIECLISPPEKTATWFKDRLANLSCHEEFVEWHALSAFRIELEILLSDLKVSGVDGRTGFELLLTFFENDKNVFENCDDDGFVAEVFCTDAVELLRHFGSSCDDKDWMCQQLFDLYSEDSYGVRGNIFDNICEYIPQDEVSILLRTFQEKRDQADGYRKASWSVAIESLARQLKDPELFEQTRRQRKEYLRPDDFYEIARMWLAAGDAGRALSILEPLDIRSSEHNRILLAIQEKLGDTDGQERIVWKMFKENRSEDSFRALLEVIGVERRQAVIEQEALEILACKRLSYTDANFLVEHGCIDEAQRYLVEHAEMLHAGFYFRLVPLAQAMKEHGRLIIATILYRKLLDSVLKRGYTKAYHHGVHYLRELEGIAKEVADWEALVPHEKYVEQLHATHGRKASFWSQV